MTFKMPKTGLLPGEIRLPPPPRPSPPKASARYVGSLLGLSLGDALGACVEFRPRAYLLSNPVREMRGGGTWGLKPGQWTDDTSMALCLASSLLEKNRFDPYDQLVKYKWWFKDGYLSSTGHCFDIGNATQDSLQRFIEQQTRLQQQFPSTNVDQLEWRDLKRSTNFQINCSSPGVAGNGALMRLAPVPLFFSRDPTLAVEYSGQSARLTHGDEKAVDACRLYGALIVAALQGQDKEQILDNHFVDKHRHWFGENELHSEILKIAAGSYKNPHGYDGGIRGKGYIVKALEAALWAFWSTTDFRHGALAAVNLGDDTDTTAAIFGQLAGAFYGVEELPEDWKRQVYASELLTSLGQWLYFRASEYQVNEDDQEELRRVQTISNNSLVSQPTVHSTSSQPQQRFVDNEGTTQRRTFIPEPAPRTRVYLTPSAPYVPSTSHHPDRLGGGRTRVDQPDRINYTQANFSGAYGRPIPVEVTRTSPPSGRGNLPRRDTFGTSISPSSSGYSSSNTGARFYRH